MSSMDYKNEPTLSEYQKSYIELIAKKTAEQIKSELVPEIRENRKRITKIERKVFNGFGTKINILFVLYSIFIALLIKIAFF